ncbi:hypothetical protein [Haloarchaeobius amylolyticus]|uniref:hypothetical protein n=1 Tax=Haloarchaeobius amylolyticus TaxID=1198296 RepID=UPI00226DF624|nr:hypothetical protein [Haloarchaeobius amylolyticus]
MSEVGSSQKNVLGTADRLEYSVLGMAVLLAAVANRLGWGGSHHVVVALVVVAGRGLVVSVVRRVLHDRASEHAAAVVSGVVLAALVVLLSGYRARSLLMAAVLLAGLGYWAYDDLLRDPESPVSRLHDGDLRGAAAALSADLLGVSMVVGGLGGALVLLALALA